MITFIITSDVLEYGNNDLYTVNYAKYERCGNVVFLIMKKDVCQIF